MRMINISPCIYRCMGVGIFSLDLTPHNIISSYKSQPITKMPSPLTLVDYLTLSSQERPEHIEWRRKWRKSGIYRSKFSKSIVCFEQYGVDIHTLLFWFQCSFNVKILHACDICQLEAFSHYLNQCWLTVICLGFTHLILRPHFLG